MQQKEVDALERQRQALELRKAGVSYATIAERLGYASTGGAHKAVATALKKTLAEPADDLRQLELERLDALLQSLWRQAKDGNQGAVDRCIRIMERRAKLLGLDAPVKQEITGKDGDPLLPKLTDEERLERMKQLAVAISAAVTEEIKKDA